MNTRAPLILVAEDDRASQLVARDRLKRLGYAVHVVSNGQAALDTVIERGVEIALILMDCHMPVMDGYSATQAIRKTECYSRRHIPIVAVTASSTKQECVAAGMDDFIEKPYSNLDLINVIGRWLDASPAA